MHFKKMVLVCAFAFPLYAGDIMVERMQSVVNEVSELRERYEDVKNKNEACLLQLQEQSTQGVECKSSKADAKRIDELELENEKLKEVHTAAKEQAKRLKELEAETEVLLKEKNRLNASAQILVEKNHSILEQLNKLKRSKEASSDEKLLLVVKEKESIEQRLKLSEQKVITLEESNAQLKSSTTSSLAVEPVLSVNLEKENKALREALTQCQNKKQKIRVKIKDSKGVCTDDNPFPKLLKKETKPAPKKKKENVSKSTSISTSGVYRIKGESSIYDAKEGKVIEIWEDTRSFTSNVFKDEWIKITGYFVDKKWRKASNEMWVKRENTIHR